MKLPDAVPVTADVAREILRRHGLPSVEGEEVAGGGIINSLYRCGNVVLRVPRKHRAHVAQMRTEAVAAPLARFAGLQVPQFLAYDESCELLPVPYSIFEWVPGRTIESLELEPHQTPDAWTALGREVALLHTLTRDGIAATLPTAESIDDPRELVETRARGGYFTASEVRWLLEWLERLAPAATRTVPPSLLHLDTQATNVLVGEDNLTYRALLDWGCTSWGDAARASVCHFVRSRTYSPVIERFPGSKTTNLRRPEFFGIGYKWCSTSCREVQFSASHGLSILWRS